MIAIVRVPYLSEYNLLDVREEPVASSAAGYLQSVGVPFQVFDFHLDRAVSVDTLVEADASVYLVCVRGTGLHWKYAERITLHLLRETDAQVIIYGQTGKLQAWRNPDSARVRVVFHDEAALAEALGIQRDGPRFDGSLLHYPYGLDTVSAMGGRQRLFKATFETTRGCHFGCKFCFINHGQNYAARFIRRPTESVIEDMRQYVRRGWSRFWFYDSEFIGADPAQFPVIEDLMVRMRAEFDGDTRIMLYSRASTLERFGNYKLLADSGVDSVLVGVESLDDADLKAMKKGQNASRSLDAIRALRDHGIFCNLSFILFNRNATTASIRRNIERMASLYEEPNFIFLGQTLYFSYAFESDWGVEGQLRSLSGKTRLSGSTSSTRAPVAGVIFDPKLEPLAEIYRIINYEQVRKLSELNLLKETSEPDARTSVHRWATLLTLFSLNLMLAALDDFDSGDLTLETAPEYETQVYRAFARFNRSLLPAHLADTITNRGGYTSGDWNGWDNAIPMIQCA